MPPSPYCPPTGGKEPPIQVLAPAAGCLPMCREPHTPRGSPTLAQGAPSPGLPDYMGKGVGENTPLLLLQVRSGLGGPPLRLGVPLHGQMPNGGGSTRLEDCSLLPHVGMGLSCCPTSRGRGWRRIPSCSCHRVDQSSGELGPGPGGCTPPPPCKYRCRLGSRSRGDSPETGPARHRAGAVNGELCSSRLLERGAGAA